MTKKSTSTPPRRTRLAALALVGAAALLQGCAGPYPGVAIPDGARAAALREAPAAPAAADFPAIADARWKQGTFPSADALRRMGPGMGKDQVRELLSWPHFSEGLFGAREWNYLFHFRTDASAGLASCQYMVRFNQDMLTTGTYWKDPACARHANPAAAAAAS